MFMPLFVGSGNADKGPFALLTAQQATEYIVPLPAAFVLGIMFVFSHSLLHPFPSVLIDNAGNTVLNNNNILPWLTPCPLCHVFYLALHPGVTPYVPFVPQNLVDGIFTQGFTPLADILLFCKPINNFSIAVAGGVPLKNMAHRDRFVFIYMVVC